jgi:hypothetical protein
LRDTEAAAPLEETPRVPHHGDNAMFGLMWLRISAIVITPIGRS